MKTVLAILPILLASWGWPGAGCAAPAMSWRCLGRTAPGGGRTPERNEPMYVFGGEPLTFELAAEAPAGSRVTVQADLIQVAAGGLAATLQKNVPLGPELTFDRDLSRVTTCTLPELPVVQRTTRAVLMLRATTAGVTSPPALTVPLIIYPHEEPGRWKKALAVLLLQSGLDRLAVFGEGKALRGFLRQRQVDFADLGEDWPSQPEAQTLYLGETTNPAPAGILSAAGLHLALFSRPADSTLLPGFYSTLNEHGGRIWKVSLPGLLDDPGNDPRALETLTAIFRQTLAPPFHSATPTSHETTSTP